MQHERDPSDVERLFTPAEARAALKLLGVEIASLGAIVDDIERARTLGQDERALELRSRIDDVLEAIRVRGVHVRSVSPVTLDFPARRFGVDVALCWRADEGETFHWHARAKGCADRRSLASERPGAFEYAN